MLSIISTIECAVLRKLFPTHYTRPMIKFAKKHLGKNLTGVEIGVAEGHNAKTILLELDIKKLFLVDPYQPYVTTYKSCNIGTSMYDKAKSNLSKFAKKTMFIRKTSEKAARDIPNNLDFVYVDGNHDYEYVKQDITLYYPKVKQNGIIGGHDFCTSFMGLCKAVLEFANERSLKVHGLDGDWWIIK